MSTLRGQQARDNPHLVKCLARALCLSKSSTSACERDFGNLLETFRKMLASPMLKEMHLRVTNFLKLEPGQSDEVVRRARAIWNEGYSAPRLSGSQRSGNFVSGMKLRQKRQDSQLNFLMLGAPSKQKCWGGSQIGIFPGELLLSTHLILPQVNVSVNVHITCLIQIKSVSIQCQLPCLIQTKSASSSIYVFDSNIFKSSQCQCQFTCLIQRKSMSMWCQLTFFRTYYSNQVSVNVNSHVRFKPNVNDSNQGCRSDAESVSLGQTATLGSEPDCSGCSCSTTRATNSIACCSQESYCQHGQISCLFWIEVWHWHACHWLSSIILLTVIRHSAGEKASLWSPKTWNLAEGWKTAREWVPRNLEVTCQNLYMHWCFEFGIVIVR